MAGKKKINWLLILQGWAMLLVIIGHSSLVPFEEAPVWDRLLFQFAYSFHMPLFMLISGFLFYQTRIKHNEEKSNWGGYKELLFNKFQRLLIPGLFFSIVALLLKFAFPGEMERTISFSLPEIIRSYLYPFDNAFRELWFVVTLMWMFVLAPLWRLTFKHDGAVVATVVVLLLLHLCHPSTELLCLGRLMIFAIWFYLGMICCKYDWVSIMQKNPYLIFLIGSFIYIVGLYLHDSIATCGGIIFSFAFAFIADKFLPQLFCTFRNYTYQIYLIGIFAQIFVKIIAKHSDMPYVVGYLLCVAAAIYVPVIISRLVKKINWPPLSICVGLK